MPRRWERDQDIARRHLKNVRFDARHQLAGIGGEIVLSNRYSDGVRDTFDIYIIYPDDFLHAVTKHGYVDDAPSYPSVYLMSHRNDWEGRLDGHILSDWSLCLYVLGEADINFRDHNSLERLLEVTHAFLLLERIYQRRIRQEKETGVKAVWPGPQRSHGLDGYIEAIDDRGGLRDDDLCICGSGLRFACCHKQRLEKWKQQKLAAA
jgi:hypothetical protein